MPVDQPDQEDLLVPRAPPGQLANRDHRVEMEKLALLVETVKMALPVSDTREHQDTTEIQDMLVLRALRVLLVLLVLRALRVLKDWEPLARKALRVLKALRDLLGMM